MKGFKALSIRIWTWASLTLAGLSFTLLFPDVMELQTWLFKDWHFISFPVWFLSGIILGLAMSAIIDRWPEKARSIAGRALIILFAYFGMAIIIALSTGEGEGMRRIGDSAPLKIWIVVVWALISLSPSMLGVIGIMNRYKWARGGSVMAFVIIAMSTMIFFQARSAEILVQDPIISIIFVVSLIAYVEGINWSNRYLINDEKVLFVLWRRQVIFTILFLATGSMIAFLPFVIAEPLMETYEGSTVLGKALVGALLLVPFGLIAFVKNLLERNA